MGSVGHYVTGAISVFLTVPWLPESDWLLSLLLPALVGLVMEITQYMGWRKGKETQTVRNALGDVAEYVLGGVVALMFYVIVMAFI